MRSVCPASPFVRTTARSSSFYRSDARSSYQLCYRTSYCRYSFENNLPFFGCIPSLPFSIGSIRYCQPPGLRCRTPLLAAARRNIAPYKRCRHLLHHDCYQLLPGSDMEKGQWQAVRFVSPSRREAVVLAFRTGSPQARIQLSLRGLRSEGKYEVSSANGSASNPKKNGTDCSRWGIAISLEHSQCRR